MMNQAHGLAPADQFLKRLFDIVASAAGLFLTGWLILIAYVLASRDTGESGFFRQTRVGKKGKLFQVIKVRTMRNDPTLRTTVTASNDPRITRLGRFFRRTKIDELPQLINVLRGEMSFVGPRPDVPGFADKLTGEERIILTIRPGITGPATLKFRNEEELLAEQDDPEAYNRDVIYPEKVRLNRQYIEQYSFVQDLRYIWRTFAG
jgi:lipopolysaccharide/colanic/teichoic acid biosynthesis glycosyltransferase